METLKQREKGLHEERLQQYIRDLLDEKDVFLESASRFGTPQYFFDEPRLSRQIALFDEAFSGHFDRYRVFYAVKSNAFPGICKRVVASGWGLDVSSGFELSMGLASGCRNIVFSGPGKTDEELLLAIRHRDRVTLLLDSSGELQRVSRLLDGVRKRRDKLRLGIRVRDGRRGTWNKFGIPLKDLRATLRKAMDVKGAEPSGIQFHASWNLEPSSQIRMINEIGAHIRRHVSPALQKNLRFLDIGGGFWPEQGEWLNPQNTTKGKMLQLLDPEIRFRSTHHCRDARPLGYFAGEIARAISAQGPPLKDLEIWMEPGRWISDPTMHVLLTVIDKKDARTVITDGGTGILGWERPLTEFIPIINLSRPSMRERPCRIFGSLCTPYDIWGTSYFGEEIQPRDLLIIPRQGAYAYSLRQSFIKPRSRVVRYEGNSLEEVEEEERFRPVEFRCRSTASG